MDKVAKGMSEAGRQAQGYCPDTEKKPEGLGDKVKDLAKGTAQKVGEGLKSAGQKIKDTTR